MSFKNCSPYNIVGQRSRKNILFEWSLGWVRLVKRITSMINYAIKYVQNTNK